MYSNLLLQFALFCQCTQHCDTRHLSVRCHHCSVLLFCLSVCVSIIFMIFPKCSDRYEWKLTCQQYVFSDTKSLILGFNCTHKLIKIQNITSICYDVVINEYVIIFLITVHYTSSNDPLRSFKVIGNEPTTSLSFITTSFLSYRSVRYQQFFNTCITHLPGT